MGNSKSDENMGLRVIWIWENSPASKTDLKNYLDFVVGV